jgi:site-specific recombinase XerD
MKLSPCIQQFFAHYLPDIKGVSKQTIKTYRDTFTLFLPFVAKHYGISVDELKTKHLNLKVILAFLNTLEKKRHNTARTRNQRLAALKSLATMIKLFYPQDKKIAETLLHIPQKRYQKRLVGFLTEEELFKIFDSVDIKSTYGYRDYTILNLLYNSGLRASEIATITVDNVNAQENSLTIVGKGNRLRQIRVSAKISELLDGYIKKYRPDPAPVFKDRLFINQRGEGFTRFGIYRLCKKYLVKALPAKRLKALSAVHSFRHACAVSMLYSGKSIAEIRNHLGHETLQSTTIYLTLDIAHKREVHKKMVRVQ